MISLLIVSSVCCRSQDQKLIGTYVSDNVSYFELIWLRVTGIRSVTLGFELELKPNQKFGLSSCSAISDGNWKVQGDSILLTFTSSSYRIDSLNYTSKRKLNPRPINFGIEGNKLISYLKRDDGKFALMRLKKVKLEF